MSKQRAVVVWILALVAWAGWPATTAEEEEMGEKWRIWQSADLLAKRAAHGRPYLEFIDVPALSAGVYEVAAGEEDRQPVHEEDEIYYILAGRGSFFVDGAVRKVRTGDVIYVKAHIEHRFFEVEEDLQILVFFSTAASDG